LDFGETVREEASIEVLGPQKRRETTLYRVCPLVEPNEAMAHEARMEEWFTPRRQNTGASKPAETNTLSTLRSKPWTAGTEAERNGRSMHKSIEPSEEFSLDIAFHGKSSTKRLWIPKTQIAGESPVSKLAMLLIWRHAVGDLVV
jgi:hypothetical protein